ncbi:MAG: hypothetical protein ACE141_15665 [Bryobacteraceae bacterium]
MLLEGLKRAMTSAEGEAKAGNWQGLRGLAGECRKTLELLARMSGELEGGSDKGTSEPAVVIMVPSVSAPTPKILQLDVPGQMAPLQILDAPTIETGE